MGGSCITVNIKNLDPTYSGLFCPTDDNTIIQYNTIQYFIQEIKIKLKTPLERGNREVGPI